jgi:hypothetical protein
MALVSIPTPALGWGFFFPPAEPSIRRLPREYPYASLLPMLRHVGSDVFTSGLPMVCHIVVWRLRSLTEESHGSEDGASWLVCRH